MKNNSLKIPAIIIVVGLVLALAASMLTGIVKEPVITEHDFPFSVTYRLDGETKTLEGVYNCCFTVTGEGTSPLNRYYEGTHVANPADAHSSAYTIAEKDGYELCIVVILSDSVLMGDPDGVGMNYDPYLAAMDSEGVEYGEEETRAIFDAEIIEWVYPEPVDNSFKFAGFSHLHAGSMIAMLVVGILAIVACMIFVKRDKTVPYKALDKVSIVLNFVMVFAAIPFATLVAALMPIYVSGGEFVYQLNLCIPAITAFTVAASVALRRGGFTKAGFFTQFAGPVLFLLTVIFG